MADKEITVNDFRMWLEGVEEMQDANWVPDERQWRRIREKINEITEKTPVLHTPGLVGGTVPIPRGELPPVQPAGPSMMPNPAFSQGAPRLPTNLSPVLATGGQAAVRTPDIDTQGKPYESSFA